MKRTAFSRFRATSILVVLLFTRNANGGILSGFLNFAATQTNTAQVDPTAADAFPSSDPFPSASSDPFPPDTSDPFPPDTSDSFPPNNNNEPFPPDNNGPFPPDNRGPFQPDNSGPFPPDNNGIFPPDNNGPFPPDNNGPFPPDNNGPFPPDNNGPFPPDNNGPFPPDNNGPFPPDNNGSFPPDNNGPFPPDNNGPFPPDNNGPFPPDNNGPFPPDNNGPFPPDNNGPFPPDNHGAFPPDNNGPFPPDNTGISPDNQELLPADLFIPVNTDVSHVDPNAPSVTIEGPFPPNIDHISPINNNEAALISNTKVVQDSGAIFPETGGIINSQANGQGNGIMFNSIDQSNTDHLPTTGVLFEPPVDSFTIGSGFPVDTNALGPKEEFPRDTSIGTVAIKATIIKSPEDTIGVKTTDPLKDLSEKNIGTDANVEIDAKPITDSMAMPDALPKGRGRGTVSSGSDFGMPIGEMDPSSQGDFGTPIGQFDPNLQGDFGMPVGQVNIGSQADSGIPMGEGVPGSRGQGVFGGPNGRTNTGSQLLNPGRAQSFLNSLAGHFTSGIRKPSKPKNAVPNTWTQLYVNGNRPNRVLQAATAEVAVNVDPPLTDSEQQLAEISNQSFGKHRGLYRRLRQERIRNRKLRRDRVVSPFEVKGRSNKPGRNASLRLASGNNRKVSIAIRPSRTGRKSRRQKRQLRCNPRLQRRGLCQMEPQPIMQPMGGMARRGQMRRFQRNTGVNTPRNLIRRVVGGIRQMRQQVRQQRRQPRRFQGIQEGSLTPVSGTTFPLTENLGPADGIQNPGKMIMGGGGNRYNGRKRGGLGREAIPESMLLPLNDASSIVDNAIAGVPMIGNHATSDVVVRQGKMKKNGKGKRNKGGKSGGFDAFQEPAVLPFNDIGPVVGSDIDMGMPMTGDMGFKQGKMKKNGKGKRNKGGKNGGFVGSLKGRLQNASPVEYVFQEPAVLPFNDIGPVVGSDIDMGMQMTGDTGFKQGKIKKGKRGKDKRGKKGGKRGGKKGGLFAGKMVKENKMRTVLLDGPSLVETTAPEHPSNTEMLVLEPGQAAQPVHQDSFETIPGLGTIVWDRNF